MIVPVTRKEKLLNAIATNGNVDFSPKTREELFLFKILGADVNAPTPITRKEILYQHIIDGTIPTFEPRTRLEKFIMAAAGVELELPVVLTREEYWWAEISDSAYETITGAIVHFISKKARAIKSLIANISYTQDLNGYSYPWPAGGGDNLLNTQTASTATASNHGLDWSLTNNVFSYSGEPTQSYVSVTLASLGLPSLTLPAGSYKIYAFDKTGVFTPRLTNSSFTIYLKEGRATTLTEEVTFDRIVSSALTAGEQISGSFKIMACDAAHTAPTSFSPYSNICPISGWTGANVYHSGADTSDATTYSITFPSEAGTVYGGMVDVTNGKLTVTHGQIASYAGESLPGEWISDRDVYSAGATPTTGAQVVYELATPQTYQLTPTEVTTLLGDNTIWADTGDVSVTY